MNKYNDKNPKVCELWKFTKSTNTLVLIVAIKINDYNKTYICYKRLYIEPKRRNSDYPLQEPILFIDDFLDNAIKI